MIELRCTECGVCTEAKCECNKPYAYITASEAATRGIAAHPDWSDQRIADETGVNRSTVRRAREATCANEQVEKREGKDGKSRPTQRKSPQRDKAREAVRPRVEAGEKIDREKLGEEVGVSPSAIKDAVIAERARKQTLEQEPQVTREMLSLSAQEKFDAAIRRELKRLEKELGERARTMAQTLIEDTILPSYIKSKEEYDSLVKLRRGMMTKAEYRLILACLHPDNSMTGERRQRAWDLFSKLEIAMLDEKEFKTSEFDIPRTYEDLMAMRRQRSAARRSSNKSVALAG